VAVTIGVDTCTVTNWEKGHSHPELRYIPRIIDFLGYEPSLHTGTGKTLGEKIKQHRILRGITQKELAKQIGIDPTTLSRIERNRGKSFESVTRKVLNSLGGGCALPQKDQPARTCKPGRD